MSESCTQQTSELLLYSRTLFHVLKFCSVIVVLLDKSSKAELLANERATSSKSFKKFSALAYRTKKENNLCSPKKDTRTNMLNELCSVAELKKALNK